LREHKMPSRKRTDRRPTVISLFTGAGGLDLGLEVAGFRTVTALDFDEDCVASLRANQEAKIAGPDGHPFLENAKLLHADVAKLSRRDLVPAGAKEGWVPDLLAGGPPCQPFSSAGKQMGLDDPRGRLFEHFVRLARELKPKLILFENVRGLVTAPGPDGVPGEALSLVRGEFERIGYGTTFALLNSADFGAPQRRVRMFMLAARQWPLPSFPEPTHSEDPAPNLFDRKLPWVTLGEFLKTQPRANEEDIDLPSARLAELLAGVPPGSGLKSAGARESTRPGGHWGYKQGTFVADTKKPARTVTAAATQDWVRQDGVLRRLTWRECAGLQGFPPGWTFVGGKASKYRQIGNAVPSVFGVVLGKALLSALAQAKKGGPVESAPWPPEFEVAVKYTKREKARNGESRRLAREALAKGEHDVLTIKGFGSTQEPHGHLRRLA
jgi:DNA (cytosine-5)-methyltransferase 1